MQLVNQRMAEAVTSFVSGAVPAVALWVPFDVDGEAEGAERAQDRRRLGVLSRGGDHGRLGRAQRLLRRRTRRRSASSIAGWAEANDAMLANFDAAAEQLQKTQYKEVPLADFKER